jgi:hypothetical protein
MFTGVATAVDCRYHQQDNDMFCGMASVMMVVNALDPGVAPLSEGYIKKQIPTVGGSNAPPNEVACAIETLKPAAWQDVTFAVISPSTQGEANDAIVRTLHDVHAPVATQVLGSSHWLVVVGALTDVEPVPNANYTLLGVFVNNPITLPKPRQMVHANDDPCGRKPGCGELHEFISMAGWLTRFPGTGAGLFQCVPATGTPPSLAASPTATVPAGAPQGAAADPQTQAALDAIVQFGLNAQGPCAQILAKAGPSTVPPAGGGGDPWYVTLDVGGAHAAIVRLSADANGAFTLLDVGVKDPGGTVAVLSADAMTAALQQQAQQQPDVLRLDRSAARPAEDSFVVRRGPFWRPCRESPSPFDPLYEIQVNRDGEARRYYRTLSSEHLYTDMTWYDLPHVLVPAHTRARHHDDDDDDRDR